MGETASEPTNPAGRLHALLTAAKVPPRQNDSAKVATRWAEVLEIEPDDRPALLPRLSEVIALPSQIRLAVEAVPNVDHARYLRYLPNVERAFGNLNLENAWSSFAKPITEATMHGLDICDELLSRERPEQTLSEERRTAFHDQVRALFEDVVENETDDELRDFLLRHLSAIDEAMKAYRTSGTPPLVGSIEAALGGAVVRQVNDPQVKKSPRFKKFVRLAADWLVVLSLVNSGLMLGDRILDALPMGEVPEAATADIVDAEVVEDDEPEG